MEGKILILIDNNCVDLNINSITDILKTHYSESHVFLNGKIIDKTLIANYLPIVTNNDYLKLSEYSWSMVTQFSEVVFITQDQQQRKEITIFALLYRILTGKSITVMQNNTYIESSESLFSLYPIFLKIYFLKTMSVYTFDEIVQIDDMAAYKRNIISDFSTPINNFLSNYALFKKIYMYILNGGEDWMSIIEELEKNKETFYDLREACIKLKRLYVNEDEFKFYDAQYKFYPSLSGKLQVSIPGPNANKIHVLNSFAADYNFRNLKFKNVFVSTKSQQEFFVLPFYKDEQSTRQTVRFLIMNLYNVFNNSILVDFIMLYLCMKVTLLDDVMVKTKYENIARLFMKRHGSLEDQKKFISGKTKYLGQLKKFFSELNAFDDEEIAEMFDDFISCDFKVTDSSFMTKLEIVVVDESNINLINENELKTLPTEIVSQTKYVEVNDSNWPKNLNFKGPESKLQMNSSTPFFICTPSFQEFINEINEISWIKTILKYSDKFVLKGGAILDLIGKRAPKDYDLMNIGLSNEEFIKFLIKFCKDERPEKVEFIRSPVIVFRVSLKNGDKLEFIPNLNMTRENLLNESYLPDQICYVLSEGKLLANEYTLSALNYGYCLLDMEKHPRAIRLSSKMNKQGFNFYFNCDKKTKFLKERLERYVWSLSQLESNNQPSYHVPTRGRNSKKIEEDNTCKAVKGKIICNKKILFADRNAYLNHMKQLSECDNNQLLINVDFNGAFIMPIAKSESSKLSTGIDWSF